MPTLSTIAAGLMLVAMAAAPASARPFEAMRWDKRIAVVFGVDRDKVDGQISALTKDEAALAERDMLVLRVSENGVTTEWGEAKGPLDADALRTAYGIAPDQSFTLILVGKDGGEKLRRDGPVRAEDVFDLIDSMPMRQGD